MTTKHGFTVNIVPGVLEAGALPNVMRGEETQIFGALWGHYSRRHRRHVDRLAGNAREVGVCIEGTH